MKKKEVHVKRSKMLNDGLCVWFDQPWEYYAHHIERIGEENPERGYCDTMWKWIRHMSQKSWWNPELEQEFIKEVHKYFNP